jgi:hypothetical protein
MNHLLRWLLAGAVALAASGASAMYHTFQIEQIYSNADGSVQFVVLHESLGEDGENLLAGHTFTSTHSGTTKTFTFPSNLPGGTCGYYGCSPSPTANKRVLIATQGFAALGLVTPNYVIPNQFLATDGGTVDYAGVDQVPYATLPTDGVMAINRSGAVIPNVATNFAGQSASVSLAPASSAALENPQPGSFQSGVGLLSGWSCQGPSIGIAIDGAAPANVPYGSSRADTAGVCGATNTNTGFGLLINFNLFGAGTHSAQMFVNGQVQGSPTSFTVTAPAGEFLTGAVKQVTVTDFPTPGKTTVLIWQQSQQNFAIKSVGP